MAEILGGYGDALILAGRADEAKAPLDEALSLAHELKNDGLVGQTLGFQGDALFFQGNYQAAQALYNRALQAATQSKESERILLAKIALAQVQVREKSGPSAVSNLLSLIERADEASLKYSSVEASLYMAEAMMQGHDNIHARQEVLRDLPKADKLGQQVLSAHAHYILATIARESNDTAEEQNNYRLVTQALDTMKKDQGAEKLLQRADLKQMYDDSNHWLQGGK
jgi:tetratricopeptide (TPR) repeat protein